MFTQFNYVSPPLTYEEKNALRFIAGYVSRKIYKKIQESFNPEKQEKHASKR